MRSPHQALLHERNTSSPILHGGTSPLWLADWKLHDPRVFCAVMLNSAFFA
jgi:hypothetical protein